MIRKSLVQPRLCSPSSAILRIIPGFGNRFILRRKQYWPMHTDLASLDRISIVI